MTGLTHAQRAAAYRTWLIYGHAWFDPSKTVSGPLRAHGWLGGPPDWVLGWHEQKPARPAPRRLADDAPRVSIGAAVEGPGFARCTCTSTAIEPGTWANGSDPSCPWHGTTQQRIRIEREDWKP